MVYVDNMYTISLGRFGRMKMSHMIADTKEELLQMADNIGVKRKWIQAEGTTREHFDIAIIKRTLAIKFGAKEISMQELGKIISERRNQKTQC